MDRQSQGYNDMPRKKNDDIGWVLTLEDGQQIALSKQSDAQFYTNASREMTNPQFNISLWRMLQMKKIPQTNTR